MKNALVAASLLLVACTLEKFEPIGDLCGMPASTSAECLTCIGASPCCELTTECAAEEGCAGELGRPVTPASIFAPSYDAALGCLQTHCDEACGISWGCLDGYEFAAPTSRAESTLSLLESAQETAASGLAVEGCAGTDPLCIDGVALGTTDAVGALTLTSDADYVDFFRITQPGSDPDDPGAFVPAHTRWSEPVSTVGSAATYVFRREQVQALVTVSHDADAYDPRDAHLVFFAHNCLPMRYAYQGVAPYAQAAGVTVRLEPNEGEFPVVYTSSDVLPDRSLTMTSRVGSGGVTGVPAERNLTVIAARAGRELARCVINAPQGGLGIVHLVPAATR